MSLDPVSFNILLHHALESNMILVACAEHCSGVNIHGTAHGKCGRGWFDDVEV